MVKTSDPVMSTRITPRRRSSYWKAKKQAGLLLTYVVLIVAVTASLFPFLWMVSSSLKPMTELFAPTPRLIPETITFENYRNIWNNTDFPRYFVNSFKVAATVSIGSIFISMFAAYALSRFRFRGKNLYATILLTVQMFPGILIVLPLFLILRNLGLFNTHASLMIAYMTFSLPFAIWTLRGFFDAIPYELEEAAKIDGASQMKAFFLIIVPVCGPGIAAVGMYAFIRAWNEFLFALVLLQSSDLHTLPIGLSSFMEEFSFRWDLLMAGATIITVPVLFFFLFMQRFIVQGLTAGAVKG